MTGVHKNINDNKDQNQEKQPDPKTRVDENKDDTISERTVPIKEGSVPNTLTDDSESGATTCLHDIAGESSITPQCGIQKDFERKTMDENSVSIAGENSNTSQCGIQNDFETKTMNKNSVSIAGEDSNTPQCGIQKDFERKTMNENSVSSDNAERMEIQKSMPENVTIKRSARISEKRANTLQTQPKSEKLGHEKSSAESNETKTVGQDSSQVNTVSKTLSHNISNQPAKREMASTILTQQNPLKHKSTTSSTKYTQRMSWILQPQKAPVDNINPVSVNDIVWGKVHGHPWWPGRVLAISGIRNEESSNQLDRDAHVSWFGSNTSSIMRVHGLQLFLPYFDKRHKRHKKGYYRLAVRQAQEALQVTAVKDR
ncbi:chromatin binding [Desmophyllum pertusum]|uniref:Chromatin binding n=1 Tax=Desmophyllum pertusum TaxID=174260 RepID=A0A9W9YGW7_9CNID|nr:chromatin binding [Desmophyllum pertusum]